MQVARRRTKSVWSTVSRIFMVEVPRMGSFDDIDLISILRMR